MGFLSELKKAFFGASSVAKSASEKAVEYGKEQGAEILDKAKDLTVDIGETIIDSTNELKDKIVDGADSMATKIETKVDSTGDSIIEKSRSMVNDISEGLAENPMVQKAAETAENIGSKILDKGEDLMAGFEDVSERLGEKILNEGGNIADKGATISEEVGKKVHEAGGVIKEKASEAMDKLGEKLNETMKKADAMAEAEKNQPKKQFADDDFDASGSLLEGKDDFFSKADQFADGDYGAFSEGKIEILDNKVETSKDDIRATGFDDLDGDGDEIIDDATTIEE